jgi:Domain of unknown function (DUF4166)
VAVQSLYRRLLGDQLDTLPEVLRRFHDAPEGGRARATFQVERGAGRFRNAVASLLGMPRAGRDVPVRLEVRVDGDRERWVRHFPGRTVVTTQWAEGGLLIEAFGLTSFSSAVVVDRSSLCYEFRRAWFAGVALPAWLSPYVDGRVQAGDGGWNVVVHVFAPFLGEIVHYEGWVEPE